MPMAKDLISKMIVKDPEVRWNARQCLEHPWLKIETKIEGPNLHRVSMQIKSFQDHRRKLKIAIRSVMFINKLRKMSEEVSKERKKSISGSDSEINISTSSEVTINTSSEINVNTSGDINISKENNTNIQNNPEKDNIYIQKKVSVRLLDKMKMLVPDTKEPIKKNRSS